MKRQVIWIFVVALAAALIGGAPTLAQEEATKVNINTADEATLAAVKGIGKNLAKAIIEYRGSVEGVAFTTADDLLEVDGIDEKKSQKIASQVTF